MPGHATEHTPPDQSVVYFKGIGELLVRRPEKILPDDTAFHRLTNPPPQTCIEPRIGWGDAVNEPTNARKACIPAQIVR